MSEPTPLLAPLKPALREPQLWSSAGFIADLWTLLEPDDVLPARGQIILQLERWRVEHQRVAARRLDIGIAIAAGADFPRPDDDLSQVLLVALPFPKFSDGRAYSIARRLRSAGFKGELRATGDVLFDQLPLMQRTGFDTFEIVDAATLASLERRPLDVSSPGYQHPRSA